MCQILARNLCTFVCLALPSPFSLFLIALHAPVLPDHGVVITSTTNMNERHPSCRRNTPLSETPNCVVESVRDILEIDSFNRFLTKVTIKLRGYELSVIIRTTSFVPSICRKPVSNSRRAFCDIWGRTTLLPRHYQPPCEANTQPSRADPLLFWCDMMRLRTS